MEKETQNINATIDKLFRQSHGKMVSLFLSKYGIPYLDLSENAIMEAYYKAIKVWPYNGIPDNPEAWLYRTANNALIDAFKKKTPQLLGELPEGQYDFDFEENDGIKDPELKLLFLICNPSLKKEDQLAFMLKTISGFGDHEIGNALMQKKSTIKKRLSRTKKWIKDNNVSFDWPSESDLKSRIGMVHKALYLLFSEGFYSSHPDHWIRKDLCLEAMRLCKYLVDHPLANYETNALMSLMCYHISRYESRIDKDGHVILLEDQDRTKWNLYMIQLGGHYLKQSAASSKDKSRYQVEAFISAIHCSAKDIKSTNWKTIESLYQILYNKNNEDILLLNLVMVKLYMDKLIEAKVLFEKLNVDQLNTNKTTYYIVGMKLYEKLKDDMQINLMLEQAVQSSTGTKESKLIRARYDSIKSKK